MKTLMKLLTSDNSPAGIEAELDKATRRQADLSSKLADAKSEHAAAIEARREHLLNDGDPAGLKSLEAKLLASASRETGYADALEHNARTIAGLEGRLQEARNAETRHKAAAEIDKQLDAVEALGRDISPVLKRLGDVLQKHRFDAKQFGLFLRTGGNVEEHHIKALVTAEAMLTYAPEVMEEHPNGVDSVGLALSVYYLLGSDRLTRGKPPVNSVWVKSEQPRGGLAELISSQRARAAAIRSGDSPLNPPSAKVVALPIEKGAA